MSDRTALYRPYHEDDILSSKEGLDAIMADICIANCTSKEK